MLSDLKCDLNLFYLNFFRRTHVFVPSLLLVFLSFTTHGAASTAEGAESVPDATDQMTGETQGFDSIVNDLNREVERPTIRARAQARHAPSDTFDSILFHGGVGIAALMETVSFADRSKAYLGQRGIQAAFGIDLFSASWMAECTARTFSESEPAPVRVSLQEFELKVIYRDRLSTGLGLRLGGGLSARYLNANRAGFETSYTTPSSVATVGIDAFLTDKVSFGFDINGRNAMIAETPDTSSIDATVRVDFHL